MSSIGSKKNAVERTQQWRLTNPGWRQNVKEKQFAQIVAQVTTSMTMQTQHEAELHPPAHEIVSLPEPQLPRRIYMKGNPYQNRSDSAKRKLVTYFINGTNKQFAEIADIVPMTDKDEKEVRIAMARRAGITAADLAKSNDEDEDSITDSLLDELRKLLKKSDTSLPHEDRRKQILFYLSIFHRIGRTKMEIEEMLGINE